MGECYRQRLTRARYAGWIGTVGAATSTDGKVSGKPPMQDSFKRLAAIAGTSTCHIAMSEEGILVPGVVSLS
jgi:ribulose kinase